MTGSHEVRGSIPLGSTNHFNDFMNKQIGGMESLMLCGRQITPLPDLSGSNTQS